MSIDTKVVPYEVLFRLDETGKISGAHSKHLVVVSDSGKKISTSESDPLEIDLSNIGEVSEIINAGLVKLNNEISDAVAEFSALAESQKIQISELKSQLLKIQVELNQALAESEKLKSKLPDDSVLVDTEVTEAG